MVITTHTTKDGKPKLVNECSFPLTGKGVVKRIYTDLAIIDVTNEGFLVKEMAPGVDFEYLQKRTEATLIQ